MLLSTQTSTGLASARLQPRARPMIWATSDSATDHRQASANECGCWSDCAAWYEPSDISRVTSAWGYQAVLRGIAAPLMASVSCSIDCGDGAVRPIATSA